MECVNEGKEEGKDGKRVKGSGKPVKGTDPVGAHLVEVPTQRQTDLSTSLPDTGRPAGHIKIDRLKCYARPGGANGQRQEHYTSISLPSETATRIYNVRSQLSLPH
jgi:hypothetical protein